jgi:hypothetical protein
MTKKQVSDMVEEQPGAFEAEPDAVVPGVRRAWVVPAISGEEAFSVMSLNCRLRPRRCSTWGFRRS